MSICLLFVYIDIYIEKVWKNISINLKIMLAILND